MPLVLTQNLVTAEGHAYSDVLGLRYEYPTRYARLMTTGEPFVYYRGRRGAPKGEPPCAYIGAGVVGLVSGPTNGLFTAEIEDYVAFDRVVDFKVRGQYIEDVPDRKGSATGVFFRGTSVRPVSEEVYQRVLELGGLAFTSNKRNELPAPVGTGSTYPSATAAAESDAAGMVAAVAEARARWPRAHVHRMAQNNPGFDLAVDLPDGRWYVEVKSTSGQDPRFFLSEGERLFADRYSKRYSLL
jgi:Domain of unknown function (DUF3883)